MEVGFNFLTGADPFEFVRRTNSMPNRKNFSQNSLGDVKVGEKTVQVLRNRFE